MQIKAFSQKYNVGVDTIRYYEKIGLLRPKRWENGYRQYSEQCGDQLKMIVVLKQLGFSLNEIAQLTMLEQQKLTAACNEAAVALFEQKIEQITEKVQFYEQAIQTLQATKQAMAQQQYAANQQAIAQSIDSLFNTLRRSGQND